MAKIYVDAKGLEGCPRCLRNLEYDGVHPKRCTCPDREKALFFAKARREERRLYGRIAVREDREAGARNAASAEARARADFERRQMPLPGIAPPPLCWWRDPK